jgi:hypothetical protein
VASDRGSRPVRRGLLRGGLLLLAATTLFGGIWALMLPRSFYDDFPLPGSDWVSTLGPYNEHLIRDYGALNLALAILLVAAALLLERRVVQVALVTWLVYATPHLVLQHRTVRPFLCPLQRGATGRTGAGGLAPALVALLRRATRLEKCSREYHTPRALGRATSTAKDRGRCDKGEADPGGLDP